MPIVLGLDISKSSVSACLLLEKPADPQQYYYEATFFKFEANVSGISQLLALNPDIAVMEPTGVNYQKLWGIHVARAGIEVRLVGHKELRSYRANHLKLPDKDDDADALALACYALDYLEDSKRFIQIRDAVTVRIRELVLRLAHLNRVQSPVINRVRQDLAWQFPEIARVRSLRGKTATPLLWGWLAGERKAKKYDNLYCETVGLGLTDTVRLHAARICDLQREEAIIERELIEAIQLPQFNPYRKVFARFGFGLRVQALLLSQIYPFENFLDADNSPIVKIRKGRKSGNPTKRHLSRRRFEKTLGVAPTEESSGDIKRVRVVGGSSLCRKALWQWIFTRIEPQNQSRLNNDIGRELGNQLDLEKAAGRPIKLVRSRIAAKAARLLFKELVKEFNSLLE